MRAVQAGGGAVVIRGRVAADGGWRAAWRSLKDNPLPGYLALRERRRLERLPRWRRLWPYFAVGLISAIPSLLVGIWVICMDLTVNHAPISHEQFIYLERLEVHLLGVAALIWHAVGIPVALVWLLDSLQRALRLAGDLHEPAAGAGAPGMDCALALTRLSDRELLCGYIAAGIRPALPALCTLAMLAASATAWYFWFEGTMDYGAHSSSAPLFNIPVTLAVLLSAALMALSALPAYVCLLLIVFMAGRALPRMLPPALLPALAIGTQLLWGGLLLMFNRIYADSYWESYFGEAPAINNVVLAVCLLAAWLSQLGRRGRDWLLALPLVLAVLAGGVIGGSEFGGYFDDPFSIWLSIGREPLWALSGLCLFNPLAMPTVSLLSPDGLVFSGYFTALTSDYGDSGLVTPLRSISLLALQLIYCGLLLNFARAALHRWRQGAD